MIGGIATSGGRRTWLLLFAGAAAVVMVSHELIIGRTLQSQLVREAVPGFTCPRMAVQPSGGTWSPAYHVARGALTMPRSCVADLQHRIRDDGLFREARCNLVERCWRRSAGARTYTFTFYPESVGFHYLRQ